MKNLTVYTKPNCPNCVILKNLLAAKGVEYSTVELDFGQQSTNQLMSVEAFKAQNPGVNMMPFFTCEGEDGGPKQGGLREMRDLLS